MGNVTTRLRTIELLGPRTSESASLESKLKDLELHIRSATVLYDTFVVDDLLRNHSYLIARSERDCQLTFMLKDGRQVIVAVEQADNPALVAQKIAERLMKSGYHVLRLGLGAATEAYRRCMID